MQTTTPHDEAVVAPGRAAAFRKWVIRNPRAREWLFRDATLAQAGEDALTARQTKHLALGAQAKAAADQILANGADDAVGGSSAALSLYREAVYWALRAGIRQDEEGKPGLAELFSRLSKEEIKGFAGGEDLAMPITDVLVGQTFVESSVLDDAQLHAAAVAAQGFVGRLIAAIEAPEKKLRRLRVQRWARPIGLALLPFVLVFAGIWIWRATHPRFDWAAGKNWRASSALDSRYPSAGKVGVKFEADLMFHTKQEADPWVEIDLGVPVAVTSVRVENADQLGERAIPLVLSLGETGQDWVEVGRRTSNFSSWSPSFPPRTARFVRLSAARTTYLHLERVSVYGSRSGGPR